MLYLTHFSLLFLWYTLTALKYKLQVGYPIVYALKALQTLLLHILGVFNPLTPGAGFLLKMHFLGVLEMSGWILAKVALI